MPEPYPAHSLYGLLETFGHLLIRRGDFPPDQGTGSSARCPVLLTKLLLIQRKHGWSDYEAVDAARVRLDVKACLGLDVGQPGPSQSRLSRHRAQLAELGLIDRYEERFLHLIRGLELLDGSCSTTWKAVWTCSG